MFLLPNIGPKDPVNALKLLLLPVYSINIYNNLFPNLQSPVSESCTVHTHYTTPSLVYDFSEVRHFLHLKKSVARKHNPGGN